MSNIPKKLSENEIKVSVIIPTYNRIKTLPKAIESVLSQTYNKLELIVVDDGSDDGTTNYLDTVSDERFVAIKGEHKGAGAARNTGVKNSSCNLIAFCDSDCEWHLDKLEKQMNLWKEYPESAMVYCRFRSIDADGNEKIVVPVDDIPEIECSGNPLYQHLLVHNLVSTQTMLLKKDIFSEIGGFDESLPALEDYDLVLRIAEHYDIRCCHEILVEDYVSEGSLSSNVAGYFTVRCMLIARYVTELRKYGTFDTIVNYVLERAAKFGIQNQVGEMLIRMLEKMTE